VWNGSLGQIEHGVDVDLEGHLPFLIADVTNVLEGSMMGRIIDQDIDAAQLLDGSFDDRSTVIGVLQMTGYKDGLPSFPFDQRLDLVRIVPSLRYAIRMSAPSRA
jgi:hypothetical protein